jgi:hypothetical protein
MSAINLLKFSMQDRASYAVSRISCTSVAGFQSLNKQKKKCLFTAPTQ